MMVIRASFQMIGKQRPSGKVEITRNPLGCTEIPKKGQSRVSPIITALAKYLRELERPRVSEIEDMACQRYRIKDFWEDNVKPLD